MTKKFDKTYKELVKKYGKKEVDTGIDVEAEHVQDKEERLKIASDHLEEFPTYYKELSKMEKKLKNKKGD
jgi:endo-1,4-beta-mannosidase